MSLFRPRCPAKLTLENHLLCAYNQVAEQISQKWAEWCHYNKIHDLQPQKLPLLLIGTLPCFLSELICFPQTPISSFPCPFLTEIWLSLTEMKKENTVKEKWGVGGASIRWELPQSSAYTQRLTCICSHFFLPSCGNRNSHFLDMSFPYHLSEYLLLLSIDSFSLAFQRNKITWTVKNFTRHSHLF